MTKIIELSSTMESSLIDQQLKDLHEQLLDEELSENKLHRITDELENILLYLSDRIALEASKASLSFEMMMNQKSETSSLLNICKNSLIDRNVDKITEDAQNLAFDEIAHPGEKTACKIESLKNKITTLAHSNALSLQNKYMINIANQYLNDAIVAIDSGTTRIDTIERKDVKTLRIDFESELYSREAIDRYEVSLLLYEAAGAFYNHNFLEGYSSILALPTSHKKGLHSIFMQNYCSLDKVKTIDNFMDWQENLFRVLQSLLGYANMLMMNDTTCVLPSKEEIEFVFNDPAFHKLMEDC